MLYDEKTGHKTAEVGDKIKAQGCCFKIGKILSQEYYPAFFNDPEYWIVEFLDPNGGYHRWKNVFDGGMLIPKSE